MLGLLASAWLVAAPPAPQPTEDPPPAIELPGDDAVEPEPGPDQGDAYELVAPRSWEATPTIDAPEATKKKPNKGKRLVLAASVAYGLGSAIQWTTAGASRMFVGERPGGSSGVVLGMNLGGTAMMQGVILGGIGGHELASGSDVGYARAKPMLAGGATLAALGGGAVLGTAILWPTVRASCSDTVVCSMAAMHLGGAALGVGVGMIGYGDRLRERDPSFHRLSRRARTPLIAGSVLLGAGYAMSAGVGMAVWQGDPSDDVARRTRNRMLIPVVGPWIHAAGPDAPVLMAMVTGVMGAMQIGGTLALVAGGVIAGKERRRHRSSGSRGSGGSSRAGRRVQLSVAPRLDGVTLVGRF